MPRRVKAAAYLAQTANPTPPSRRYMDAVLKGARAHKLPDDYIATLDDAGYKFGQPYLGIGGISTYGGDAPTDNIVPFTIDNFKASGLTLPYGG